MFGRQVAVVVMAGVLGLVGCASDAGAGAGGSEPTDVTAGPSTATSPTAASSPAATSPAASDGPTPVPVTGPDQQLVTMEVTGGFAGVRKAVTLRGDGSVHTSDKGEQGVHRTSPAQFTELRTLLGDPALDEVPNLTRDAQARDLFQYTLRFDGRTVITDRSGPAPALDRLIDALSPWLPR